MPFYIGTEEQCKRYDEFVNESESYPGFTSSWGVPRKHPTQNTYSIRKHWKYESPEMEKVESLSKDWNNKNV